MSTNFKKWVERFNIRESPVLHLGAHYAEERDDYLVSKFEPVLWVEAIPEIYLKAKELLSEYEKQDILNAVLSHKDNEVLPFYFTGEENSSSSILKPYLIQASHPNTKINKTEYFMTTTLDTLLARNNYLQENNIFMVLDLQGAEKKILDGASETLNFTNFILAEVSIRSLYRKSVMFNDLKSYLLRKNFEFLIAEINYTTGWGEALFYNRNFFNFAHHKPETVFTNKKVFLGTLIRIVVLKIPFLSKYAGFFSRSFGK